MVPSLPVRENSRPTSKAAECAHSEDLVLFRHSPSAFCGSASSIQQKRRITRHGQNWQSNCQQIGHQERLGTNMIMLSLPFQGLRYGSASQAPDLASFGNFTSVRSDPPLQVRTPKRELEIVRMTLTHAQRVSATSHVPIGSLKPTMSNKNQDGQRGCANTFRLPAAKELNLIRA